ncbi:hypothetical protein HEP_00414500 [Hepatocystis sp. ex Piliocolobus tephrosceles]|nr:hypothetical protein HEP_00414500 [Hepatocystis sp. ex Piliocolobus tephrosceles]
MTSNENNQHCERKRLKTTISNNKQKEQNNRNLTLVNMHDKKNTPLCKPTDKQICILNHIQNSKYVDKQIKNYVTEQIKYYDIEKSNFKISEKMKGIQDKNTYALFNTYTKNKKMINKIINNKNNHSVPLNNKFSERGDLFNCHKGKHNLDLTKKITVNGFEKLTKKEKMLIEESELCKKKKKKRIQKKYTHIKPTHIKPTHIKPTHIKPTQTQFVQIGHIQLKLAQKEPAQIEQQKQENKIKNINFCKLYNDLTNEKIKLQEILDKKATKNKKTSLQNLYDIEKNIIYLISYLERIIKKKEKQKYIFDILKSDKQNIHQISTLLMIIQEFTFIFKKNYK